MQTDSIQTSQTPEAAVVVSHEVADFDAWRSAFEGHAPARRKAGILASHYNRSLDNPNLVIVYLAAASHDVIERFMANPELKATMQRAGVTSVPRVLAVTPLEDLTLKTKPLVGAVIRHRVGDYGQWKKAFDAHGAARSQAGILGHAVNCLADDKSMLVVYVQAESVDTLRKFVSNPELKSVMQQAGVVGAPEIAFVQGGRWEA
ncbi:MAG TPA: hypothetical protein VHM70_18780 [Polyangiaceae bacterium]|jgi:hypothetical protein|nr:hypothetical protein [Polyangiaceae bacterium]